MTFRECYLETLLFGHPERIPFSPGWPRESTLQNWLQQGLLPGLNWYEVLLEELGLPLMAGQFLSPTVSFQMMPTFEEKVIEHRDGHIIVQDWMGAITEISDTYDLTYLRSPKDFVTRKWHRFPVQNREDWEQMKERFQADEPGRLPNDFAAWTNSVQDHDLVTLSVNGPFWQLREWLGFENLCLAFVEDPELIQDMVDFWSEFVSHVVRLVLRHTRLDRFALSEDMAYKAHSMISPTMVRQYLLPVWWRWAQQVKAAGCPIVDMDSDGCIEELIPIWIEAGINVCNPIEVAAHNDLVEFRRQFGTKMAYTGGVDKRSIAAGGQVIKAELARMTPVIRNGGFIPGCDHGVPPNISWPNFTHYSRLLAQLTGWIDN